MASFFSWALFLLVLFGMVAFFFSNEGGSEDQALFTDVVAGPSEEQEDLDLYDPLVLEKNIFDFLWGIHELHLVSGDSGEYFLVDEENYYKIRDQLFVLYLSAGEKDLGSVSSVDGQSVWWKEDAKFSVGVIEHNILSFALELEGLRSSSEADDGLMYIHKAEYSKLKAEMYALYIPNWEIYNKEYEEGNTQFIAPIS